MAPLGAASQPRARRRDVTASGIERYTRDQAPKLVGAVWALLMINTLGYTNVITIIPFPRAVAQVVTMGALLIAFALALVLNPRIRIRPNAYLLLLSMVV